MQLDQPFLDIADKKTRLNTKSHHEMARIVTAVDGGAFAEGVCQLCLITVRAMQAGSVPGTVIDLKKLTTTKACKECSVPLHWDCANYWHAEVVPFSRRVMNAASSA
eukprot:3815880-Rhodomonas_salina.1